MARVVVASFAALRDSHGLRVQVEGRWLAVFKVGATVWALDDACPHRGDSLAGGFVEDWAVECPAHGWCFDVRSGELVGAPSVRVVTHRLRVEGDEVVLEG